MLFFGSMNPGSFDPPPGPGVGGAAVSLSIDGQISRAGSVYSASGSERNGRAGKPAAL